MGPITDTEIAINTVWVVISGALVLFMQAGFALLEAGLTRMKNAAHIAGKNLLILGVCAVTYWAVGFGLAFGDGGKYFGKHGFFPTMDDLITVGKAPFSFFATVPAGAAWSFELAFAAVSLAIVWGAMAERTKLWVYPVFGVAFTLFYSVVSHWVWHSGGWLYKHGMQDFAGSTVVHYQGAIAGLAGALLLGPRIGKFEDDGTANAIPGHNMPFAVLATMILWLGWFGFNAGSTLGAGAHAWGGTGFFAYVAFNTTLAAAAGCLASALAARIMIGTTDISMMLNGVIAALVAITAACGFVDPWAAVVIGAIAGVISMLAIPLVERLGIDDPIGAVPVHGLAGVWGTLATGLFATPALTTLLDTGKPGLFYGTHSFHQLGIQGLGLLVVGVFTFSCSFVILWICKVLWGIRVEPQVEMAGLDITEHGMWGYPEMYIPVPGGYGTESHSHMGRGGHHH